MFIFNTILPIQSLGPAPNGTYAYCGLLRFSSSVNRSGMNFSGSGQYLGSLWIPYTGMTTWRPLARVKSESGNLYGFTAFLVKLGTGGYFLKASINVKLCHQHVYSHV